MHTLVSTATEGASSGNSSSRDDPSQSLRYETLEAALTKQSTDGSKEKRRTHMSDIYPILELLRMDKSNKKNEDPVRQALELVKFIGKIDKGKKKEEEEKKKKDAEKAKDAYKLPNFSLAQLLVLGPFLGFGWLLIFNQLLEYIKIHVH